LLILGMSDFSKAQHVEEFIAQGPMDFHNLAMSKFMEMRKKNPKESLDHDSEFMKMGNRHAVRRNRRKPEEELTYQVSISSFVTKLNLAY